MIFYTRKKVDKMLETLMNHYGISPCSNCHLKCNPKKIKNIIDCVENIIKNKG